MVVLRRQSQFAECSACPHHLAHPEDKSSSAKTSAEPAIQESLVKGGQPEPKVLMEASGPSGEIPSEVKLEKQKQTRIYILVNT